MVDRRYAVVVGAVVVALLSTGCASGVHRPLPYCSESAERRPINPTQWPGVRSAATANQPPPAGLQRVVTAPPAPVPMPAPAVPASYVPPPPPVVVTPAAPVTFPAPAAVAPAMPPAVDVQPAPSVAPAAPEDPAGSGSDRWKSIWRPAGSQSSVVPTGNGSVGVCYG
ncbi:MAG: hypothetical protein LCH93_16710 [Proteobacteria bacterium]|nr:hypothetical protein [Pseudomonadota bacterium]